jgi:hypothetical protein
MGVDYLELRGSQLEPEFFFQGEWGPLQLINNPNRAKNQLVG